MMKIGLLLTFISLTLLIGCTNDSKENLPNTLSFSGISLGDSKKKVTDLIGKPSDERFENGFEELQFSDPSKPKATLYFKNKLFVRGIWYPSSSNVDLNIPLTKNDIDFNLTKNHYSELVDCYESTKCNNYVFVEGSHKLQFQMDWEDKLIDKVVLE